ncbi:MAG: hypothetical protein QNJ63_20160 [Calothrix sp. MO_192.B10]|nr:hypothetical protein [Calothrix sp. MO_192.B10]
MFFERDAINFLTITTTKKTSTSNPLQSELVVHSLLNTYEGDLVDYAQLKTSVE